MAFALDKADVARVGSLRAQRIAADDRFARGGSGVTFLAHPVAGSNGLVAVSVRSGTTSALGGRSLRSDYARRVLSLATGLRSPRLRDQPQWHRCRRSARDAGVPAHQPHRPHALDGAACGLAGGRACGGARGSGSRPRHSLFGPKHLRHATTQQIPSWIAVRHPRRSQPWWLRRS
jgi:hypothetical protein